MPRRPALCARVRAQRGAGCAISHKLSHAIVPTPCCWAWGRSRLERLAGIRQRTLRHAARTSGGAKQHQARKNNRLLAKWTFHQLATFIAYQAERVGSKVEWVDPTHTSQMCPVCCELNGADDRRYVCTHCGWRGHRDAVGAINISRGTGPRGHSAGATVA